MLQRMHQLVRDHETGLAGIDVGGNVQGVRVGVEVARHLLREQIDHAAPQVERIRDETEQAVGGLRPGELGRRQIVVELVNHVVADLGAGTAQHHGALFEPQARRPLHGGHHLLHRLPQLGFAADLLRPLFASRAARSHTSQQRPRGEPAAPHACHSIPLPTAVPTTRATS